MRIKWLGHACFLFTTGSGIRIVTDPFDDQVGYELPAVEADIVTSSHDHFDHNNYEVLKGNFKRINSAGRFSEKGITITGVSTWHDKSKGAKRGPNIVFKYDIDGINVCHCGDLGHVLSQQQVEEIRAVDVLLVPVGGTFTVNAEEAWTVVKQLKPVVTIPMHFKTPECGFPIDGVDKFLTAAGSGKHIGKREIEINRDNIAALPAVLVLDYK